MTLEQVRSARGRLLLERIGIARTRAVLDGDLATLAPWVAAPGWPTPDTAVGLSLTLDLAERDEDTAFLVVEPAAGRIIGDCGTKGGPSQAGDVEIGYGLAASARGQGLGTEMVATLTGWLLSQRGIRRILAEVLTDNLPSRRALERVGYGVDQVAGDRVWYALRASAS